jgi:hypothetical protein
VNGAVSQSTLTSEVFPRRLRLIPVPKILGLFEKHKGTNQKSIGDDP